MLHISWNIFTTISLINAALCAIFVPILLVSAYKYNANRKHIALQKRYANITIFEAGIGITKFILDAVALLYSNIKANDYYDNNIYLILFVILSILSNAIGLFWGWRFWMIRYDIYLENDMMNDKWKSILNLEQYVYKSWYIDNKQSYGSSKWIFKRFIIPSLLIFVIIQIAAFLYFAQNKVNEGTADIIHSIINGPLNAVIAIILLIIYCKMPQFEDNFFVLYELKRIISWYVISSLINAASNMLYLSLWYKLVIVAVVINPMTYIGYFCAVFISTYIINRKVSDIIQQSHFSHKRIVDNMKLWVIHSNNNDFMESLLNLNTLNMGVPVHRVGASLAYTSGIINIHPSNQCLQNILTHNASFEFYMRYISKDFSMNILLGFVECIQFQQWLLNAMQQNEIDTENNGYSKQNKYPESLFKIVSLLTDTIPESLIVSNANISDNMDEKQDIEESLLQRAKPACFHLFKKYIEYGSYYEVNLRDDTREEYREVMEHKDDWLEDKQYNLIDILYIFDSMCNECYVLMLDSCQRFQQTSTYEEQVQPFIEL